MDNAEDLDIVAEYSKIFSKESSSLWKNYKDEPNDSITN